ncbi:MAG: hypothetical protein PHU77_05145 [Simplicispira sp.]|nr:hypothetical protein [Simplicispira sp.]
MTAQPHPRVPQNDMLPAHHNEGKMASERKLADNDTEQPVTPTIEVRSVNTTRKQPSPQPGEDADSLQFDTPKLPHERDESVGMTGGAPSAVMQQAYRDVERGLVNTDAGREAHSVGKPVIPPDPAQPGTPGPVEPDHK